MLYPQNGDRVTVDCVTSLHYVLQSRDIGSRLTGRLGVTGVGGGLVGGRRFVCGCDGGRELGREEDDEGAQQ